MYSCTRQIARITHNCQLEVSDTQSVRIRTDGISESSHSRHRLLSQSRSLFSLTSHYRVYTQSSRQISCSWDRAVSTFVSPPRTEMSSFRRRRHIMLVSSSSGFFPVALDHWGRSTDRGSDLRSLQITLTHLGHGRNHRGRSPPCPFFVQASKLACFLACFRYTGSPKTPNLPVALFTPRFRRVALAP